MHARLGLGGFLAGVALATVTAHAPGQSITFLPDIPGGTKDSVASGVSDDGQVVSGYTFFANNQPQAFRWTRAGGTVPIGPAPTGMIQSAGFGISGDGAFVVGFNVDSAGGAFAVKWDAAGMPTPVAGPTPVGSTFAAASTADGSVVVGADNNVAMRWPCCGGAGTVIAPVGGAWDVTPDGAVVVGRFEDSQGQALEAFRWTSETGAVGLGFLDGGNTSNALGVSADGSVVVGGSSSAASGALLEAIRWTPSEGMKSIGRIGTMDSTVARAVTADGSVIVGSGDGQRVAFIWDAARGMRPLAEALEQEYGIDLNGFPLHAAEAISADGRFISGFTGVSGDRTAWLVEIPEPSAALAAAAALWAALARGRRRPRERR